MSEDVLKFITVRRSIRTFRSEPVDRAKLEIILKAAMAAPSASNSRPWEFLVITDRERLRAVCQAHPYAGFGADAGVIILPFGKKESYRWFDQDMGAATENLLIAVANLGLGATWCGMTDDLQKTIRDLIGLPEDLYVFAVIPIGVPAEVKPPRTQYEAARVHWGQF